MSGADLIGPDGEVVASIEIDNPTMFIQRPVAKPFTLDQLRTMTLTEELGWGLDEDDPIPPLPGDLDDPRMRLPEITFEQYRLEGMTEGRYQYRRIR